MNFIIKHKTATALIFISAVFVIPAAIKTKTWYTQKGFIISSSPDRQYSVRMLEYPVIGMFKDIGFVRIYNDRTGKKIYEDTFDYQHLNNVSWYRNCTFIESCDSPGWRQIELPSPIKGIKSLEEHQNDFTIIYKRILLLKFEPS